MFSASCRGCGRPAPACTVHRAAGRRHLVGKGCMVFQFDTSPQFVVAVCRLVPRVRGCCAVLRVAQRVREMCSRVRHAPVV
eukprot:599926-Prymnesium_polylepis.1